MSTKIVSYFSYKGGAGRSTLAFNTIPLLMEHIQPTAEAPVVVVDMDIDSCGLSYLLGVKADQIADDACLQHVLANGCRYPETHLGIAQADVLNKLIPVGDKLGCADPKAVLFLPAQDNRNVRRNANNNYEDDNFRIRMKSFVDACKAFNVPAIIMDSAVGNQATALITNGLADVIVCCVRPTTQFVEGTARYLRIQDSDMPTVTGEKTCIIVPNVVPQEDVTIDGKDYPETAIDNFFSAMRQFIDPDRDEDEDWQYNSEMMDRAAFGIPAVPSFMWRESQLCSQAKRDENEEKALNQYRKLAKIIYDIKI